jgi:hypothetical protein
MAGRAVLAGPAAEFPESTADVLKRIQGKHYRLGSKPADRQALWNRYIGLKVTSKTATLAALRALEAALDGELKQRRLA